MVCVVKAVKTPGLVVMVEEEEVMKVAITTFSSSTLTKAASTAPSFYQTGERLWIR